jgi:hypothetical protein
MAMAKLMLMLTLIIIVKVDHSQGDVCGHRYRHDQVMLNGYGHGDRQGTIGSMADDIGQACNPTGMVHANGPPWKNRRHRRKSR